MDQDWNIKRLHDPFSFKDVEWKIQFTSQDKTKGMAVAYLNSRAIQARLDEVIGASNWKNSYVPWQNNAQLCGLSIYDTERGEWVAKYDGAENTDIEAIKGGLSDSFKRAACVWGIGRYLYQLDGIWIEIEQRGKSYGIKADQYPKLEDEYNKAVVKIFYNAAANQEKPSVAPTEQKAPPASNAADNAQPTVEAKSNSYRVQSVKPSGKKSQLVELKNASSGEVISAYIQKSDDAVKAGSILKEVDIVPKDSAYGQYNMINSYKIAA